MSRKMMRLNVLSRSAVVQATISKTRELSAGGINDEKNYLIYVKLCKNYCAGTSSIFFTARYGCSLMYLTRRYISDNVREIEFLLGAIARERKGNRKGSKWEKRSAALPSKKRDRFFSIHDAPSLSFFVYLLL